MSASTCLTAHSMPLIIANEYCFMHCGWESLKWALMTSKPSKSSHTPLCFMTPVAMMNISTQGMEHVLPSIIRSSARVHPIQKTQIVRLDSKPELSFIRKPSI